MLKVVPRTWTLGISAHPGLTAHSETTAVQAMWHQKLVCEAPLDICAQFSPQNCERKVKRTRIEAKLSCIVLPAHPDLLKRGDSMLSGWRL